MCLITGIKTVRVSVPLAVDPVGARGPPGVLHVSRVSRGAGERLPPAAGHAPGFRALLGSPHPGGTGPDAHVMRAWVLRLI